MAYSTDDVMEKAKETANEVSSKACGMAKEARDKAGEWTQKAQQGVKNVADTAASYAKEGRQRAEAFEGTMEGYVRERPISAVFLALGIGLLLGAVVLRR